MTDTNVAEAQVIQLNPSIHPELSGKHHATQKQQDHKAIKRRIPCNEAGGKLHAEGRETEESE